MGSKLKNLKVLIIITFFNIILPLSTSLADIAKEIKINGNQRITKSTIIDLAEFEPNKNYTIDALDQVQKKIFKTNFFQDVNVKLKNNILIVSVIENPVIDFFYIKGIVNSTREEIIYDEIKLGQNKVFSESILKKDIETIKKIYTDSGFFDVNVSAKISKLENNNLNVVLEIQRSEKYKINRVYFIGSKFFSSSSLYDVVSSSEYGWWKFLSSSTTINQSRIDLDKQLLKNFYLDEGFYDAQITSSDVNFISNEYADLTYSINSGKRYIFDQFEIIDNENNLNSKSLEDLKKIIKKETNGNYSRKKINYTRELIYNYLNLNKVEFVQFAIKEKKNNSGKINLKFIFGKSQRNFVNLINVKGNSITDEDVIRRNLTFSEGDTFLRYKLEKSKTNLRNTRIFKDVKTKVTTAGKELVDLEIDVEEQPTGSISAGVGVGTDESTVSTGIQENNLFGKGINVNSILRLGTEKISGNTNLYIPDFKNTGNTLGVGASVVSTDYANAGYESTAVSGSSSISYNVFEDISFTTGIGLERDKIDTNSTASSLYKSREGSYMIYKGFYSIVSDKRDSKVVTTDGYRMGFGQTLAVPGSDVPYIANNVYASYYHPVSKDYILSLKGGANSINGFDNKDVKLSDRKFLSSKKLRGFQSYGIGPKDGKDHVGGNYSAHSSISSTFPNPLPDKWNASSILFVDAGNVWGVDYDSSKDSDKIRSSAGLALDWISPLGPLSFVFAETISSAKGDKEESFSFNIGSTF